MSTLQPGGAFEVALYDSDFFTNASNDDLLIRPILDRQHVHIGTNSNANSSIMITSNTVFVNNNLYLYSKLGVGKSNLFDDYPVDIIGNAAIDGSINSTKYVLCRGLQLKKKFGSYYETTSLPTGLIQGLSNDGVGLVMYINGGSETNYLKFLASNQNVFHVEGSGNVGIGTSNPAYKLDIVGTISTSEGVKIGSNFIWNYSNVLGIDTASNLTMLSINKTSGYVGIATKTPSTSFDISTTDAMRIPTGTTTQRPSIPISGYMRYNTTTSSFEGYGGTAWGSLGNVKDTNQDTYISAESFPTSNDDIIRFYNSNNETLRITVGGNIGVSNKSPSERLEVNGGNAKFNSNIYVLQRLGVSKSNPTEIVDIIGNLKASSNIYSFGRIGVDTSNPTERLEVQGNTKITNNAYVMNWMGVGTSNPTVDFDVIGSAKIGTNLEVIGNMTVRGTSTTVDSQTVTIKDNIIRINNGATYISSMQAGLEVNRGTGYSNYYFIYDEPTSLFKIGQPQSLQAVATREDNPIDSTIPFYSFTNNRYSSCNNLVFNGGKLGVGLQTPQEALHVDGSMKLSTGQFIFTTGHLTTPAPFVLNSFNGGFYFRKLTSDSNISSFIDLALLSNSNLYVYGNSYITGNVGIGTSAPTRNLHILGSLPTILIQNLSPGTGNTQLRFQHSNGTTLTEIGVSSQSNVFIANKQQGSISFETNSLQRMSISSNGYVGIGTSNPISLLNVDGGGYTTNTYPTIGHAVVNYSNNGGMGGSLVLRNSGGSSTLGSKAGIAFELDNTTAFNQDGTDAANASIYGIIETAANNVGALTFNTWNGSTNGERVRMSSAGMIVNGTSVLSGAQLTVNSKLFVGASTSGGNYTDAIIHIAKSSAAPSMTFEYNGIGTGHIRLESGLFRWVGDGSHSFEIANGVTNTNPTSTGTTLMRITGAGNVGIGTSSPSFKLHNALGSAFIGDISYASTTIPTTATALSNANGYRLVFDNTFNGTPGTGMAANKIVLHNNNFLAGFGIEAYAVTYHSGGSHNFYINTNNTNTYGIAAMTLNTAGNIGIGTISPYSKARIHLSGESTSNQLHFSSTDQIIDTKHWAFGPTGATFNAYLWNDAYSVTANWLQVTRSANTVSSVSFPSGNFGIGTTSPSYKLDVVGSTRFTNGTVDIYRQQLRLTCDVFSPYPNILITKDGVDSWASVETFNNYRYIKCTNPGTAGGIDFNVGPGGVGIGYDPADWGIGALVCNGSVGIGTRSPSYKLDVIGDLRVTGNWYWSPGANYILNPTANGQEWSFDLNSQNTYTGCYWQVWSDKNATILACRGDTGNVGIGTTSPVSRFHINDTGSVTNSMIVQSSDSSNVGVLFRCRDGSMLAPNYDASRIETGWESTVTPYSGAYIKFQTHATNTAAFTNDMIIKGGNVGIGVTNPAFRLHVGGDIYQDRIYLGSTDYTINYYLCRYNYDNVNFNWGGYPSLISYNTNGEFRVHGNGAYSCAIRCDGGYLSFTGCHEAFRILPESCLGLIVIANGRHITEMKDGVYFNHIVLMDALPEIDICTKKKDKRVYGVLSEIKYHNDTANVKKSCKVNSIGEGGIWVTDANGPIENGDYITSSDVHGYGEKQDECYICNYTVAKITQDCNFNPASILKKRAVMTDNHISYDDSGKLIGEAIKDENGQDIYDLEYLIRYVRKDGSIITKLEYDVAKSANEEVYKAAFVGCTYHCG